MATMKHRRTTVASIFQNGISQNTKCANKYGFHKFSHMCEIYENYFIIFWYYRKLSVAVGLV